MCASRDGLQRGTKLTMSAALCSPGRPAPSAGALGLLTGDQDTRRSWRGCGELRFVVAAFYGERSESTAAPFGACRTLRF